ncbi:Spore germination protein A1 [compost metagenome]
MILGATLGLYGVGVGLLAVLIHLVNMSSFGTAYMTPIAPFQWAGLADSIIRAPWRVLRKRHHYSKHRMD